LTNEKKNLMKTRQNVARPTRSGVLGVGKKRTAGRIAKKAGLQPIDGGTIRCPTEGSAFGGRGITSNLTARSSGEGWMP